ncbi:hypothetical protein JTE90_024075 [Oedothorax gibbosus]|uniref:Uncharacterized protein n=1 Tax=Oedothorax gibbosus TaxID=931172 RepID=A0AAV6U893_9ARAC|nr:hypothetical protein JTE90_024075 [Oedothorax gibbosus]
MTRDLPTQFEVKSRTARRERGEGVQSLDFFSSDDTFCDVESMGVVRGVFEQGSVVVQWWFGFEFNSFMEKS